MKRLFIVLFMIVPITAWAVMKGSVGGAPATGSSLITTLGTVTSGTWNGSTLTGTYGGTGVNNGSNTITLGNNLTTGSNAITLNTTGGTSVTLPTSGTLVNSGVTTLSSLATVGTITSGTWNGSLLTGTYGGTGVNNGSNTITLGGNLTTSGANNITLTTSGPTSITLPTSGTLLTQAAQTLSFQPGLLSTIVNTKGGFVQVVKASTVDNLSASAITFSTCSPNPVITMYECGVSATCASPTTIGTVTLTAAGAVVASSLSSTAIAAGDYVAFAVSSGTCVALNAAATAQIHSN